MRFLVGQRISYLQVIDNSVVTFIRSGAGLQTLCSGNNYYLLKIRVLTLQELQTLGDLSKTYGLLFYKI